jgi:hypothetical protein
MDYSTQWSQQLMNKEYRKNLWQSLLITEEINFEGILFSCSILPIFTLGNNMVMF